MKKHTFPGEKEEMPIQPERPEIKQPNDPKEPEIPKRKYRKYQRNYRQIKRIFQRSHPHRRRIIHYQDFTKIVFMDKLNFPADFCNKKATV
jgi:hypothetical protein